MKCYPHVKNVMLWDLDGTVINSFGRVAPCLDANGNLDLQKYINTACTHDKVMTDSLLPLAEVMKAYQKLEGTHNIVITARTMGKSDYYFLRKHGLITSTKQACSLMSRDRLHKYFDLDEVLKIYRCKDGEYKGFYFDRVREMYPNATITMIDDHKDVLAVAVEKGFRAVDATLLNDIIGIGATIAGADFLDDMLTDFSDPEILEENIARLWETLTVEERESLSTTVSTLAKRSLIEKVA